MILLFLRTRPTRELATSAHFFCDTTQRIAAWSRRLAQSALCSSQRPGQLQHAAALLRLFGTITKAEFVAAAKELKRVDALGRRFPVAARSNPPQPRRLWRPCWCFRQHHGHRVMFLCSQMVRFGTCAQARSARFLGGDNSPTAQANWVFSPEWLRCALVQAPGQVQQGFGEGSEGSGEGLGGFGAEPGQVQQGSGEGSEPGQVQQGFRRFCKGLEVFGAQPGQVQQGLGGGSGEGKVWEAFGAEPIPEKVPEKVGEALVQSQVRFNKVPEKVPVKVWEALVQGQVRFNRVPEKALDLVQGQVGFNRVPRRFWRRFGRLWCRARSGSPGFWRRFWRRVPGGFGAEPSQVQQCFREGSGEGLKGFGVEPGQVQSTGGSSALLCSTRQKDL